MGKQIVICEGCGSRWALIGVGNQLVATLVECPLCTEREVEA